MKLKEMFAASSIEAQFRRENPQIALPKSTQQYLELGKVGRNGIFEPVSGRYTKRYLIADSNYITLPPEQQQAIHDRYSELLRGLGCDMAITWVNELEDMEQVSSTLLYPDKNDGQDVYRHDYNERIKASILDNRQGIKQSKYITLAVDKPNQQAGYAALSAAEVYTMQAFSQMGAELTPLDTPESLHLIWQHFHSGEGTHFTFDFDFCLNNKRDVKNDIVPHVIGQHPLEVIYDNRLYSRAFTLARPYASELDDNYMHELMSLPYRMIATVHITPVPKDIASRWTDSIYMSLDNQISRMRRKRVDNKDYYGDATPQKKHEHAEAIAQHDEISSGAQNMHVMSFTLVVTCDSMDELTAATDNINTICDSYSVRLTGEMFRQREAINTALPIGCRYTHNMRTILTDSLFAYHPFFARDVKPVPGALYYGNSQLTQNVISLNRKLLNNPNGIISGIPGGGKSLVYKSELCQVMLQTDDDAIIIDPKSEYGPVVEAMGGAYVDVSMSSGVHINPLQIPVDAAGCYSVENWDAFKASKTSLLQSITSLLMGRHLNPLHLTLADRCIRLLYAPYEASTPLAESDLAQPVLPDFVALIRQQPTEEGSKELAGVFEPFTEGTLRMFSYPTNVDMSKRAVAFGVRNLPEAMREMAMLMIIEFCRNKVSENFQRKRCTWFTVDELHELLNDEYCARFIAAAWKEYRAMKGICTGIIQNIGNATSNPYAKDLISNSEFKIIMKQPPKDRADILKAIDIHPAELRYVINAAPGVGVICYGAAILPFDCRFTDMDMATFKLFDTDPYRKEREEAK